VPIILIPLIWLAAMTLVVAACQVAANGDACESSCSQCEHLSDERAPLDQHQAQDRVAMSQRRYAAAP
jgi:hypothetical protein